MLWLAEVLSRNRFFAGMSELLERNLNLWGNPKKGSREYRAVDIMVSTSVKTTEPFFKQSVALASRAIIDDDDKISGSVKSEIVERLEKIATYIRRVPSRTHRIDYDGIFAAFDMIIALFP